jgi:hypothetical protein
MLVDNDKKNSTTTTTTGDSDDNCATPCDPIWEVPCIMGNDAQLILGDKTVTYNYVKTIHQAYSHPLLSAHIQKRDKWSEATMKMIDWTSLGQACHRNHTMMRPHSVCHLAFRHAPNNTKTNCHIQNGPSLSRRVDDWAIRLA